MEDETFGASFSIDVTDLKTGLTQANRLIKESESQFKAAAAGMDNWQESEDGLNAKIKSLSDITGIQKKKVEALKEEYQNLIDGGLDPASKQAVEFRTKINNEEAALAKNEKELGKQKKALENLGDESKDAGDKAEKSGKDAEKAGDGWSKLGEAGKLAGKALAAVGAACAAAVGSFFGLAESTREARTNMAKLETGFTTAGHSAEDATKTYATLYGVLGDDDKATEASAHLAKLTNNQEELATWTNICTGVYATFGDSLPIEGLTEAANETAKTGHLTGVLADALNWAGVNEDDFQASLDGCSSEQERQALITNTLNGLYDDAATKYKEVNKDVIASQEAQAKLNQTLNELGAIAEPIMTTLKNLTTDLLQSIIPFVKLMGEGLSGALAGSSDAAEKLSEGLGGILTTLVDKITAMLPMALSVVATVLPALVSTIVKELPTIVSAIVAVVPELIKQLLALIPDLIDAAVEIIVSVMDGISAMLPEIVKAVIAIIPKIVNSLIKAVPQLLKASITLLQALVQALPVIATELIAELPTLIDTIISTLIDALPQLLEAALTLFNALIDAIPVVVESLLVALPTVIDTIINGLLEALPLLLQAAITLFNALVQAIPVIVDLLIQNLPQIINSIINGLMNALPLLLSAAVQLFMAIIQAIPTIIRLLIVQLPQIINTITNTLISNVGLIISAAVKLFMGIVAAIPLIITTLVQQVPAIGKAIIEALKNSLANIGEVGTNLVKGLWAGINDMVGWIGEKIAGFGKGVLNGLKNFFGIHSPSKLMEDQIGKNLALGIGKGFEKNIGAVNDEITSAMNFDDPTFNVGVAGNKNKGVTIYQTNNYSQAHSRYELYKSKQQTAAAVRLALSGV